MATSLDTRLKLSLLSFLQGGLSLGKDDEELRKVFEVNWKNGATAAKANELYYDRRTLAGSASEFLDFASLTQPQARGNATITFTTLKLIYVANLSTEVADTLKVSAPAWPSGPLNSTAEVTLYRGWPQLFVNAFSSWAVDVGTKLKVENLSASSVSYDVAMIGHK